MYNNIFSQEKYYCKKISLCLTSFKNCLNYTDCNFYFIFQDNHTKMIRIKEDKPDMFFNLSNSKVLNDGKTTIMNYNATDINGKTDTGNLILDWSDMTLSFSYSSENGEVYFKYKIHEVIK